ncbi:MAG: iron ABC transporter [Chloroflexi bacterium]|nr:iron ABC transporter [Chloroflexota bacterium]|tara:strand:+ start:1139 stop:2200 length:1062 start_codon:yes stop_codon:yes gene_type:complete
MSLGTEVRNIIIKNRKSQTLLVFSTIFIFLSFVVSFISLSSGHINISISEVLRIVFQNNSDNLVHDSVVWDIRLPRIILSFFVGLALSISGVVLQGLFRNPLADPSILGVSAGAALGAVIPISLAIHTVNILIIPLFSLLGGLIAAFLVFTIYIFVPQKSNTILLLSGIAIGAFLNSLITLSVYLSDSPFQMRAIFFWLIGGFESTRWEHINISIPLIILSLIFLIYRSKEINLIMIGDEYASSVGVQKNRVVLSSLFFATLATSAAVSVSGILAFVGLVVPHLIRLLIGHDNRLLLPISALAGGFFVLSMDFITRIFFASSELRVGVIMSLIGGPFFLFLLIKNNFLRRSFS